jgi:hypothetical protein
LSRHPSGKECALATAVRATTEYSPNQHLW